MLALAHIVSQNMKVVVVLVHASAGGPFFTLKVSLRTLKRGQKVSTLVENCPTSRHRARNNLTVERLLRVDYTIRLSSRKSVAVKFYCCRTNSSIIQLMPIVIRIHINQSIMTLIMDQ